VQIKNFKVPMDKTSTLIYSINNLASKTNHQIIKADDIGYEEEFGDVYKLLNEVPLCDVRDKIVEEILERIRSNE
jgi:hypothetical protein